MNSFRSRIRQEFRRLSENLRRQLLIASSRHATIGRSRQHQHSLVDYRECQPPQPLLNLSSQSWE